MKVGLKSKVKVKSTLVVSSLPIFSHPKFSSWWDLSLRDQISLWVGSIRNNQDRLVINQISLWGGIWKLVYWRSAFNIKSVTLKIDFTFHIFLF